MAVSRADKQLELGQLTESFGKSESLILLEYKGLKVPEVTELRRQVRAVQGSYKVVKNTLARRAMAGTPFEALSGDWKGGGTVTPNKGDPIKVACKATYKVTGNTLLQKLRCAGADYSINATNKLSNKGGKIKGSWNEATYDANGGVTGTAKDKTIHAKISGDKFSGRMSINVSDTGHEINIMQLNEDTGTYRQAASVSLHR